MDRKEFDTLEIIDQVDYINSLLKEKNTLTNISDSLGIGRTTLRNRFKKIGFVFNKENNSYIKVDDKSMTSVINKENDECHTLVINTNLKSNIIDIAENHENIMKMLKWFESDDRSMTKDIPTIIEVIDEGIKIELPEDIDKDYRTTVRVNKEIWSRFKSFTEKNKQFTQKNLLSQALKEFIDKYDK